MVPDAAQKLLPGEAIFKRPGRGYVRALRDRLGRTGIRTARGSSAAAGNGVRRVARSRGGSPLPF